MTYSSKMFAVLLAVEQERERDCIYFSPTPLWPLSKWNIPLPCKHLLLSFLFFLSFLFLPSSFFLSFFLSFVRSFYFSLFVWLFNCKSQRRRKANTLIYQKALTNQDRVIIINLAVNSTFPPPGANQIK